MKRPPRTPRALALLIALAALPGLASARADPAPKAASAPADEGEGLLSLGKSLAERGDLPTAEMAYRRVLDGPASTSAELNSALLGLARTYRKEGDSSKAAALYERFIKDSPADDRLPDAYLELGRTLRAMGANKLALNRFYSVINSTLKLPQSGLGHYESLARTAEYEIAETFYENGEFDRAGAYFSRLQLLDLSASDRAHASFMAAHSQILAGDLETGCKSLHLYIETWPADENVPEARYLLATTLRRMNRPQEALAAVMALLRQEKQLLAADPPTWAYWRRRTGNLLANDFFQSGDTMSALAIYKSMIGLDAAPEWQLPVLYQVALCHERLFDYDEATASYRKIVAASAEAKPAPSPEIVELAQMAAWRIQHIEWLQSTNTTLASFLSIPTNTPGAQAHPADAPAPGGKER